MGLVLKIPPMRWSNTVCSQRWALKLQPPCFRTKVKHDWGGWCMKIREWKERKVCSGPSAGTRRDQLRWRGWMGPFTGSNERVPAEPWMRVGPSAPHRRAQTSDLENYPGSTLGQSPQQQAGVRMVTRRFNQCLTASSAEQRVSVCRRNSAKSVFFLKTSLLGIKWPACFRRWAGL